VTKERCKDLIGRRARLTRDVLRRDGIKFRKGTVVEIEGTWRGDFHVVAVVTGGSVRRLDRSCLELLP
jgi:hypothetical protein